MDQGSPRTSSPRRSRSPRADSSFDGSTGGRDESPRQGKKPTFGGMFSYKPEEQGNDDYDQAVLALTGDFMNHRNTYISRTKLQCEHANVFVPSNFLIPFYSRPVWSSGVGSGPHGLHMERRESSGGGGRVFCKPCRAGRTREIVKGVEYLVVCGIRQKTECVRGGRFVCYDYFWKPISSTPSCALPRFCSASLQMRRLWWRL